MSASPGQKFVGAYMDGDVAERFYAWARERDGSTSAALRRLILGALGDEVGPVGGVGRGTQVGVRLRPRERIALTEAARARGTTPANWLRSLAIVHLARTPQWSPREEEMLRAIFAEVRSIAAEVQGLARVLSSGVGREGPPGAAQDIEWAAEEVRVEMRRLVAVLSGNFDYWGLPDAERPVGVPGATERAGAEADGGKPRRRRRRRRVPFAS